MTVDGVFFSHLALVAVQTRVRRPRPLTISAGDNNLRGPSASKGRSLLFWRRGLSNRDDYDCPAGRLAKRRRLHYQHRGGMAGCLLPYLEPRLEDSYYESTVARVHRHVDIRLSP